MSTMRLVPLVDAAIAAVAAGLPLNDISTRMQCLCIAASNTSSRDVALALAEASSISQAGMQLPEALGTTWSACEDALCSLETYSYSAGVAVHSIIDCLRTTSQLIQHMLPAAQPPTSELEPFTHAPPCWSLAKGLLMQSCTGRLAALLHCIDRNRHLLLASNSFEEGLEDSDPGHPDTFMLMAAEVLVLTVSWTLLPCPPDDLEHMAVREQAELWLSEQDESSLFKSLEAICTASYRRQRHVLAICRADSVSEGAACLTALQAADTVAAIEAALKANRLIHQACVDLNIVSRQGERASIFSSGGAVLPPLVALLRAMLHARLLCQKAALAAADGQPLGPEQRAQLSAVMQLLPPSEIEEALHLIDIVRARSTVTAFARGISSPVGEASGPRGLAPLTARARHRARPLLKVLHGLMCNCLLVRDVPGLQAPTDGVQKVHLAVAQMLPKLHELAAPKHSTPYSSFLDIQVRPLPLRALAAALASHSPPSATHQASSASRPCSSTLGCLRLVEETAPVVAAAVSGLAGYAGDQERGIYRGGAGRLEGGGARGGGQDTDRRPTVVEQQGVHSALAAIRGVSFGIMGAEGARCSVPPVSGHRSNGCGAASSSAPAAPPPPPPLPLAQAHKLVQALKAAIAGSRKSCKPVGWALTPKMRISDGPGAAAMMVAVAVQLLPALLAACTHQMGRLEAEFRDLVWTGVTAVGKNGKPTAALQSAKQTAEHMRDICEAGLKCYALVLRGPWVGLFEPEDPWSPCLSPTAESPPSSPSAKQQQLSNGIDSDSNNNDNSGDNTNTNSSSGPSGSASAQGPGLGTSPSQHGWSETGDEALAVLLAARAAGATEFMCHAARCLRLMGRHPQLFDVDVAAKKVSMATNLRRGSPNSLTHLAHSARACVGHSLSLAGFVAETRGRSEGAQGAGRQPTEGRAGAAAAGTADAAPEMAAGDEGAAPGHEQAVGIEGMSVAALCCLWSSEVLSSGLLEAVADPEGSVERAGGELAFRASRGTAEDGQPPTRIAALEHLERLQPLTRRVGDMFLDLTACATALAMTLSPPAPEHGSPPGGGSGVAATQEAAQGSAGPSREQHDHASQSVAPQSACSGGSSAPCPTHATPTEHPSHSPLPPATALHSNPALGTDVERTHEQASLAALRSFAPRADAFNVSLMEFAVSIKGFRQVAKKCKAEAATPRAERMQRLLKQIQNVNSGGITRVNLNPKEFEVLDAEEELATLGLTPLGRMGRWQAIKAAAAALEAVGELTGAAGTLYDAAAAAMAAGPAAGRSAAGGAEAACCAVGAADGSSVGSHRAMCEDIIDADDAPPIGSRCRLFAMAEDWGLLTTHLPGLRELTTGMYMCGNMSCPRPQAAVNVSHRPSRGSSSGMQADASGEAPSGFLPCPGRCGVVYCSEACCRQAASAQGHARWCGLFRIREGPPERHEEVVNVEDEGGLWDLD